MKIEDEDSMFRSCMFIFRENRFAMAQQNAESESEREKNVRKEKLWIFLSEAPKRQQIDGKIFVLKIITFWYLLTSMSNMNEIQ